MKTRIMMAAIGVMLLVAPVVALASDVTGAYYLTTVRVTNSSTAATNVSTNFTLSTADMIAQGMLNATATDAAMRDGAGNDVAFMPAWTDSNPWVTFVPAIGASSQVNQYLYSNNATGGKIRYFPATGGMTVADTITEPSANFSVIFTGYVDTTASANLLQKVVALKVSTGSGNITASIYSATTAFVSPTSTVSSSGWGSPGLSWDGNTGTFTTYTFGGAPAWSTYLTLARASTLTDSIRFWVGRGVVEVNQVEVDAFYNATWNSVYAGNPTWSAWNTIVLADVYNVTEVRIRLYDSIGSSSAGYVYEIQLGSTSVAASVSTATASAEHTVNVTSNATTLGIQIDGGAWVTTAPASVPDNANVWTFVSGGSMPYMESVEILVGGNQKGYWSWQYAATFTDQSDNGNTATPTFRTTTTNANVLAEVASQSPVSLSGSPSDSTAVGWTMVESVPVAPNKLVSTGTDSFPGRAELGALASANRIPAGAVETFIAFGSAVLAFIAVFSLTHRIDRGIRGSLLFADIAAMGVLILWWRVGGGVIPGWIFIPFGMSIIVLLLWRNPNSTPI